MSSDWPSQLPDAKAKVARPRALTEAAMRSLRHFAVSGDIRVADKPSGGMGPIREQAAAQATARSGASSLL